ncbi:ABC transporter substrate-binding protein [Phyllobacterium sp. 22229]|uniref:ABC transporter substrate-binding protein n=1 Tax=Agrobacterium radiobacter TaxID=362 RepID=A0ABD5LKS1_AGRRD
MKLNRRTLLKASAAGAASFAYGQFAVGQTNDPIRIGVITSLSGPGEPASRNIKLGIDIATAQINKTGGINGRRIALEVRDDKGNVAQAIAMARELLGSGVNLFTGTSQSAVALAIGPVMQQENGVIVGSIAASDKINHQNFNPHYFRASETPLARFNGLAQLAAQRFPDATRWFGILPDYEYGHASWSMFVDGLLKFYPSIVGKQPEIIDPIVHPFGTADFRPYITNAMRKQFDGFFMGSFGNDSITFYQQARPFRFTERAKAILDGGNEFVVSRALGKNSPSVWSATYWYPGNNQGIAASDALLTDYQTLNGRMPPEGVVAEGHADILLLAKAISVANSTETAAVMAAMKGLEWETATGKRRIRAEDNQSIRDPEFVFTVPANDASGFTVADSVKLPGDALAEPPTPGQALELRRPA